MTTERAILAGGCFWGVQDLLRRYDGVISTRVGYSGGNTPNATYRNHGAHAEAVEIGHDEIEDHAGDAAAVEPLQGRVAIVERFRLVAETLQHGFHQTPLHRIVVDHQNTRSHCSVLSRTRPVPNRATLGDGR